MKTPEISIIAALDQNRGIGKDNRIPWRIKEDLVRLRDLTVGNVAIIGRTTYESMLGYYRESGRPTMSQRTHLVVSRDLMYEVDPSNGLAVHSVEGAIELSSHFDRPTFIMGGQEIYQQTIDKATKLHVTLVEGNFNCDVFFPDYSDFRTLLEEQRRESDGYKYKFQTLIR